MDIRQIDDLVERYLRRLERTLPQSASSMWDQSGSGLRLTDDKLIRMLELGQGGDFLALCSHDHQRALFSKVGRVFLNRPQFTGPDASVVREPTAHEAARALGWSYRKYRRVIGEAHERVRLAVEGRGRAAA